MHFDQVRPQRRRSERIAKSLPIVVRGTDLLGQPFEERTATLNFNLHGCRYASRYHLPRNAWVTLEVPRGSEFENARARVAWIQRPHSVREFFQVSVELEAPQNIWGFEPPPEDWTADESASPAAELEETRPDSESTNSSELQRSNATGEPRDRTMDETNAISASESVLDDSPAAGDITEEVRPDAGSHEKADESRTADQPGTAERRESWISAEGFEHWKREFEQLQSTVRERLAGYQTELLGEMKAEFEQNLQQAKWLIGEIEKSREALHGENEAANDAAMRLARERAAAAETAGSQPHPEFHASQFASEEAADQWRQRLAHEMDAARGQWNELLQSSLDTGIHRLAEKLSERASEVIRPLIETLNTAKETAGGIKHILDEEVARAKTSLEEIERSAAQVSGLSGQIDSATSSALDDLNRRLEMILNAQTEEMGERAERLTSSAAAKASSEIETASRSAIDAVAAQIESKLSPHYERVSELLRELSSKQLEAEESLRLQRERLRQVSEASRHEFVAQFESVVAEARTDFEAARQTAAAKWNEEIEATAALASRASADAAQKAAQEIQERSRARLEASAQDVLASTSASIGQAAAEAKQKFTGDLEAVSADRLSHTAEKLEQSVNDLTSRSRTEMERAAEAAAAGFGQVLREVSDQEIEAFRSTAVVIAAQQKEALEASARRLLGNFETNAESSLGRFHQQMTAQLESSIAEGRSAIASESNASVEAFRAQRAEHEKEWTENLERIGAESAARYQERINTASDSWVLSSVRRLNEHGQNVVESLMRSADDAVRESCAKLFDGLAEILREQASLSAKAGASAPHASADAAAAPPPDNSD